MDLTDAIKNTISVSRFRTVPAEEIFAEVRKCGAKIVIKDDQPECILLSPAEYIKLYDELNILRQEKLIAEDRENYNEMLNELDMTENDLEILQ